MSSAEGASVLMFRNVWIRWARPVGTLRRAGMPSRSVMPLLLLDPLLAMSIRERVFGVARREPAHGPSLLRTSTRDVAIGVGKREGRHDPMKPELSYWRLKTATCTSFSASRSTVAEEESTS
eukprot:6261698-Prymnesium_polylepis.2